MANTPFFQDPPKLANTYTSDAWLKAYLARVMPEEMLEALEPDFERMGQLAATEWMDLAREAESQEPVHVPFDAWGKRVDEIKISEAWKKFDRISAEEGLIATGYARKEGELSRVHQFVRHLLFAPSSAYYYCPLAMTDGAARALELFGDDELKRGPLSRLTSTDPKLFWTSGQWMTERAGGSDVSSTATEAKKDGAHYRLYGNKFFTSATTAQMAMALGRIEGHPEGSAGLSLFYVELRGPDGKLRDIRVDRLKDKLGTRALPTAELELLGARARLVGGEGGGVRKISALFNITRMYNSLMAVAAMRRSLQLVRDYSARRVAFGKKLSDQPLHIETVAAMETETAGAFLMTFKLVELLGREETGKGTAEESAVLRLLTPVTKLWTGKKGVAVVSEALESFGGAGYMEDTGLPVLLRDTQVLPIWEGTTNVLSLDMLRALDKDKALMPFLTDVRSRLAIIKQGELQDSVQRVKQALVKVEAYVPEALAAGSEFLQAGARGLAFSLARIYGASLLLEHAQWGAQRPEGRRASQAAIRWCSKELAPLIRPDLGWREGAKSLAFD